MYKEEGAERCKDDCRKHVCAKECPERPKSYDSKEDTIEHIRQVGRNIEIMYSALVMRARRHDASKLEDPEKAIFDEFTPKLKGLTYGSEEYKETLAAMKPALDHHYANNRHHPEHHDGTLNGMTLLDVIEMFCDWCAATFRHADGNIEESIEKNQHRFGYSDDIKN